MSAPNVPEAVMLSAARLWDAIERADDDTLPAIVEWLANYGLTTTAEQLSVRLEQDRATRAAERAKAALRERGAID